MKTRILTIALLAATLGCHATPIDEAPSTPPTNVIAVFDDIIAWYQVPSETLLEEKRNATDNSIEHSVKVYTFQVEEYKNVIRNARQAFEKDAPLSYQYGLYEPGHKDTFRICTGDTPDQYIITRTQDNQGYYYINVKNNNNPRLRDNYTLLWEKDGDVIKGKIYMITSLRPDLMEKENKSFSFSFSSNNGMPEITTIGVDTCLAKLDISKYLQGMEKYKQGMEKYKQGMEIYKIDMEKFRKDMDKLPDGLRISKDVAGWSPAGITKQNNIAKQLNAYKQLLEMQQDQINTLEQQYKDNYHNPGERRHINQRLRKLHKQAQKTTDKMEKLIKELR